MSQLTNTDLKQYLSEQRNEEEAFRAALEVLISRCDPSVRQPYLLSDLFRSVEGCVGAL
ncbi:hypothetical protein [Microcoleus sp. FACHB-831]|uniref:DUF6887 family protein n=1 Tax=Microcoleus sp. FACHB-831 TaxID=2692827 RepID=UPI0035C8EE31